MTIPSVIGAIARRKHRRVRTFDPTQLFSSGEAGGWYDPSDLTTLFQDSAGTTPVTTLGQPVGRILDKSGRGNHLIQATSASRPLWDARINLLTYTEQIDNAVWVKRSSSVTTNGAVAPDGTTTADAVIENTANDVHDVLQDVGIIRTGTRAIASVYAKPNGRSWFLFNMEGGPGCGAYFNVTTGTVGTINGTVVSTSITSVGNGWYRCTVVFDSVDHNRFRLYVASADNTVVYTGNGTSGLYFWGADLRLFVDTSYPYQRVAAAGDYADVGVPRRLAFDGVDDALYAAATVNLSATNTLTVAAGVQKITDAADGVITELTATLVSNNGAANLLVATSGRYSWSSKGTVAATATSPSSGTPAPGTHVLTGLASIAGDTATLRVNGVQVAQSTGDQGTGNYANALLYVGRRGGTTLPLNGRLYQLIVRGATTSGDTLTNLEQYVAGKTGVTL